MGYKVDNLEGFFPKISDWNNGEWDIDHAYNPNEIVTNGNDIYMAKTCLSDIIEDYCLSDTGKIRPPSSVYWSIN